MLLQFNFKNFKSFRDDTTLDLTATKITEYGSHVIAIANEKVLPIAAIFGANASGKSNVQEAFRYMHIYVEDSFEFGGEEDNKRNNRRFFKPTPYLFNQESRQAESSFEVYFIDPHATNDKQYNYGFAIDQEGVTEEWLNYTTKSARGEFKRIFYRHREEKILDMPGISPKHQENIRIALQKEVLVVSLGAKLKNPKLKAVRDWFLKNDIVDFGEPAENYFLSRQLPDDFVDDPEVRKDVVKYFSAFDSSIIDFEVEIIEDDDRNASKVRISAVHKMNDSDDIAMIPLQYESAGTLKMFALYPPLKDVLQSGGVLFVDELNARLHPLLVRAFIIEFLNPESNPKHAQLVFTSHDTWQLNNNMLRRDEVWFVEKETDGASSLYSLAEFTDEDGMKIRKDENYEKNYLLGKYGAIPMMDLFDVYKGE